MYLIHAVFLCLIRYEVESQVSLVVLVPWGITKAFVLSRGFSLLLVSRQAGSLKLHFSPEVCREMSQFLR